MVKDNDLDIEVILSSCIVPKNKNATINIIDIVIDDDKISPTGIMWPNKIMKKNGKKIARYVYGDLKYCFKSKNT